jgi:hypothetical protein
MWSVDLDLEVSLLDAPILATELRTDPRFAEASIIRAPRHANPHRLRRREWKAIAERAP